MQHVDKLRRLGNKSVLIYINVDVPYNVKRGFSCSNAAAADRGEVRENIHESNIMMVHSSGLTTRFDLGHEWGKLTLWR